MMHYMYITHYCIYSQHFSNTVFHSSEPLYKEPPLRLFVSFVDGIGYVTLTCYLIIQGKPVSHLCTMSVVQTFVEVVLVHIARDTEQIGLCEFRKTNVIMMAYDLN